MPVDAKAQPQRRSRRFAQESGSPSLFWEKHTRLAPGADSDTGTAFSGADLDSDFFAKAEMMSRQSAPQVKSSPLGLGAEQSPFASLADKKPSPTDHIDILISFGDALIGTSSAAGNDAGRGSGFQTELEQSKVSVEQNSPPKRSDKQSGKERFPLAKLPDNAHSKPRSPRKPKHFRKRKKPTYYSKASQRWNWARADCVSPSNSARRGLGAGPLRAPSSSCTMTGTASRSGRGCGSRPAKPPTRSSLGWQANLEAQPSATSQRKRSRSQKTLRAEQLRLRAALKSIEF